MPTNNYQDSSADKIMRFQKVTKVFGDLTVLRELDFDVAPQEKVTIVGPSGSDP
jgi:polar amino acid transport system ATP-binding protein